MFWLNLYLGYLSGASIIEDEEGGLAKVHSFVSGPSDPLPSARQATMAAFYRWAAQHPRRSPLTVDIGFLYGRHEAITGGMSLNTERPVRVWEGFGPATPEWEYGQSERGWLLMDMLMPGVWLCPILQDPARLRRWFSGTPHGLVDIVPLEADAECLSSYRLLILPGWNTMREEDVGALVTFVERGGTLVLGLPQLQTSAERTKVVSQGVRDFISADSMARLCGLRLTGATHSAGSSDCNGKRFELGDGNDGPVQLAAVVLEGTARAAALADGRSIVVEQRLGHGRVFTFTTMEYFGHRGLLPFANAWMSRLLERFDFDLRLEGGDGEVAFFAYPENGHTRVFLVNTDWTVAGNQKTCRLIRGSLSYPVTVTEGQVAEILVKNPERGQRA
ncbi:MAG: beta-galactosidase trimerization domain-containing protein [Kiritimatiellae bacterium]|nr:beta-galactosidase trimerization domain-containing protein [Kiritimatiellia bacterium]